MAAAILAKGETLIHNVPDLTDVEIMLNVIEQLGTKTHYDKINKTVTIDATDITSVTAKYELVSKMRASFIILGALVSRCKEAIVALPGGCAIGSRPIDLHIKGFEALGAKVDIYDSMIHTEAKELVGSHIYMDQVSVGATINVMMAATLAKGKTVIENAAKEPHIVDVASFLNSMGANIKGAGTDVIRISGVEKLKGTEYSIIPDQIEAGTFMVAAAATKGDITIKNVIPKHLEAISSKLKEIGAVVMEYDDAVRVVSNHRLRPTNIKTLPYPGFPTDMQPQMAVILALSDGTSIITESIFENRFKYVDELFRMGGQIKVEGNTAIIDGVEGYKGAKVVAPDLRAGAALVIAGLAAEGYTTVDDIKYILRGYEDFDEKIRNLGGQIAVVETDKDIQKFKLKAV